MRYLTLHEVLQLHAELIGLSGGLGGDRVDEQERTILAVASGAIDRASLTEWLRTHATDEVG